MKFKVKISAMDLGRIVKFNHTFETPDFEPIEETFFNHSWTRSIIDQQNDWLDRNYHLVIEQCESRDLYPIIGYDVIQPKNKVSKKDQALNLLKEVELEFDPEYFAIILGTFHDMYPTIKKFSPLKMLEIVFQSVQVTSKVSTHILKHLTSILDGQKTISISEIQKQI